MSTFLLKGPSQFWYQTDLWRYYSECVHCSIYTQPDQCRPAVAALTASRMSTLTVSTFLLKGPSQFWYKTDLWRYYSKCVHCVVYIHSQINVGLPAVSVLTASRMSTFLLKGPSQFWYQTDLRRYYSKCVHYSIYSQPDQCRPAVSVVTAASASPLLPGAAPCFLVSTREAGPRQSLTW